jgi:hypothetical protein
MRRLPALALAALLPAASRAADPAAPPFVTDVIRHAVPQPEARVIVLRYAPNAPAGCAVSSAIALTVPSGSGDATLKLMGHDASGAPCEGWARVHASISVPAFLTTTAVAAGSPLAGATSIVDRPWRPAVHLITELPPGAVAAEALPAGTPVEVHHLRHEGPAPGEAVTVELVMGDITIEQSATLAPCSPGRDCALLPSGKRVEGQLQGDRLRVELR